MWLYDRTDIILLLLIEASAFVHNIVANTSAIFDSRVKLKVDQSSFSETKIPLSSRPLYSDYYNTDSEIIYVCGDNNFDKKCTCINETLNCNQGYYSYFSASALKHNKIKIRHDNFIVKFVDFCNNNIVAIEKNEFLSGHESEVKMLNFCANNIDRIEDGIFDKFSSLTMLNMESNRLKSISDKILTQNVGLSLMELNLSSNNLQNLSTSVFQYLTKLKSLNLKFNQKINPSLQTNGINVTIFSPALSNLEFLNLASCNIQTFDDMVFINLRSLKKLDISHNPITTVPKAIKMLSNLHDLNMMYSEISSIKDCDFCGLFNLKVLNLRSSYHLSYIHENAFGALNNESRKPQLEEFSLITGKLSVLPEKLLDWKNVLIDIAGTSFTCNCSMAWLINDYNSSKPLIVNNLISEWKRSYKNELECNSPPALAGHYLYTLTRDFCLNKNSTIR